MKHRALPHPWSVEYQAFMVETMPGVHRYMHRWQPVGVQPSACLTIVHGLGDHGERFAGIANSIASSGLAVLALDLPGHGRSPGRRGVIKSYDSLMDEVGNTVYFASRSVPNVPVFVLGQSMGGNLVLNWTLRRPFEAKSIEGLVAVAPMLRMGKMPSEKFLRVGRWLSHRLPNFRLTTPVNVEQLCYDRGGQDAYLQDPLVHRKMSLLLGQSLLDSGQWALEHAHLLNKPTLLMHGCDDTLTSPAATEQMAVASSDVCTLKLWPECKHDLHFELPRETIITYLVSWMRQQMKPTPAMSQAVLRRSA
jgi:acylglycerol lipase